MFRTDERLLTDHDLERITGRKRSCWQKDRVYGGPNTIPFVKVGRLIRYRPCDLNAWLERNLRHSTSDTGAERVA
jgi:hypothetical protein